MIGDALLLSHLLVHACTLCTDVNRVSGNRAQWPTDRFKVVSFVGVFVKEEVVSGSVFGNSAGQISSFCQVAVDQLDCLLLYIQPLKHNNNAQYTQCSSPRVKYQQSIWSTLLTPNCSRWCFISKAESLRLEQCSKITLIWTPQAHQLYVVDAFMGKLL